jgi:hypothetical protein
MGKIFEFRGAAKSDRQAEQNKTKNEPEGLIQIKATEDGEEITISGAFASDSQYGALAMIKALNMLGERIIESGGELWAAISPVRDAKKQQRLAPGFLETTDFGDLDDPGTRTRKEA